MNQQPHQYATVVLGRDTGFGGVGSDTHVFLKLSDSLPGVNCRDRIGDLNVGGAGTVVDKIDLSAIDAKTGIAGNQAFSFIGTTPFSNTKGELHIETGGGLVVVQGDVNGDGAADLEIQLDNFTNLAGLTALDFAL